MLFHDVDREVLVLNLKDVCPNKIGDMRLIFVKLTYLIITWLYQLFG